MYKNILKIIKNNYSLIDKILIIYHYLKLELKNKNTTNPEEMIFGFHIKAFRYKTIVYLFKEIFIYNSYEFLSTKKNPFILDCGSNIGMSILYFKYFYPNCKIYAFEPDPETFELLKFNIKITFFIFIY
jgi:hypothetical protein